MTAAFTGATGPAQAAGSRSRSDLFGCPASRCSRARLCSLRRRRFSRSASASRVSRSARSILFCRERRGRPLILWCSESTALLARKWAATPALSTARRSCIALRASDDLTP